MRTAVLVLAVVLLSMPTAWAALDYVYTLTDLGAFYDTADSYGYDVNDVGQVAGTSEALLTTIHVFFWDSGVMTDVTPGKRSTGTRLSNPTDERPAYVVGRVTYAQNRYTPFYWSFDDGVVEFCPLDRDGCASAVNDQGQVVGWMEETDGSTTAFVYQIEGGPPQPGVVSMSTIGLGAGQANDINELGLVVGLSADRACMWDGGTRTFLSGVGTGSTATAVNDLGQIVGRDGDLSFFWESGTPTYLPMLGDDAWAFDINNSGTIVGSSEGHACLWQDGVVYDLNDLLLDDGWTLTYASGINESGQIAGIGKINRGGTIYHRAVLLTPVLIPEPGTVGLIGLGLGAIVIGWRKRR